MRMFLAGLLLLVALGAAGLWALAEFGGQHEVIAAEERTPVVAAAPAPVVESAPSPRAAEAAPASAPHSAVAEPAAPQPEAEALATPESAPAAPSDAEVAASAAPTPSIDKNLLKPSLNDAKTAASGAAQAPSEPIANVASADTPKPTAAKPAAAKAPAPATPSLAEQFKTRKIAYNRPPTTLILNRPIDVSLVIDATESGNPAAALQGFPGTVVERDVDLSDIVSAQLTGVGFDITTQTVERQKLSPRTQNRWQWRVTPTEVGTRTLILQIYGYESGSLEAEPLDSYRDDIMVEVKQLDQVIDWAKKVQPVFAVVAAVAGAFSALFAFLRFRGERKKKA